MNDNTYNNPLDQQTNTATTGGSNTESSINRESYSSMGLLSIVKSLEETFDTFRVKKLDELEYKLLEKDELITQLETQVNTLKAKVEQQEIEIHDLREEGRISAEKIQIMLNNISKRL